MTKREVAARLKISQKSVDRLVSQGKLVSNRLGRSVRFREDNVERLELETECHPLEPLPPALKIQDWAGEVLEKAEQFRRRREARRRERTD